MLRNYRSLLAVALLAMGASSVAQTSSPQEILRRLGPNSINDPQTETLVKQGIARLEQTQWPSRRAFPAAKRLPYLSQLRTPTQPSQSTGKRQLGWRIFVVQTWGVLSRAACLKKKKASQQHRQTQQQT